MLADRHTYRIDGGHPLHGRIELSGAKNAVTKQLVATLLTDQPCILQRVPRITEVQIVLDLMQELGTSVDWRSSNTVEVVTPTVANSTLSEAYSGVNRIPILMMGPLLHRIGEAVIPLPGGCRIGKRPIDYHLSALRTMGAEITEHPRSVHVKTLELEAAHIDLPFPSVGATENILLAAVLTQGTTVINNAATEPEIIDLILFLQRMGALVDVQVGRTITIQGVPKLSGANYTTTTDRIEAASFATAALATNGRVELAGARQEHLITFLNTIRRIGGEFDVTDDRITFFRSREITPVHIRTDVHPGYMTDWQQPLVTLLTQADGTSIVHETIYENRFGYTEQLNNMGANIGLSSDCLGGEKCRFNHRDFLHSAIIAGRSNLQARDLAIPDLRAGFAYLLAALTAKGTSTITGTRFVERGYENIPEKLQSIGGELELIELDTAVPDRSIS